jgi:hypothetical protein
MDVSEDDAPDVADAAHAVIQHAKDAGVYVVSGGLDDDVEPVVVAADGTVTDGSYSETKELSGGFTIVDVPTREAALERAAKIAGACRCGQELRAFQFDPLA